MYLNLHKITFYTILFLIFFWMYFFWERIFVSQESSIHSHIIDDRSREVRPPSVQSTLDTTEVDLKIATYFQDIVSWSEEFTSLWGFDILGRMEELCIYYGDICDRIDFDEKTHFSDQYVFMLFSVYLISQVDQNMILPGVIPLRQTIHSILFYSDKEKSRGQAWHHNVMINTHSMESQQEIFEVMTHEIAWHILDLGGIDDLISEKHPSFTEFNEPKFGLQDWSLQFYQLSRIWESTRNPNASWTNFISGYWSHSPFEEFAEFSNAWINHHYPLLMRAKKDPIVRQKYILFSQLFGRRHLNPDLAGYHSLDHDTIPFDTTRWESTQY